MSKTGQITAAMIEYYSGDVRRINHFIKVYGFAKAIGELENSDERLQEILECAALVHDIGIKNSEKKYQSTAGNYQEIEGPPEARKLLERSGCDAELIERVAWLVGHHHTYDRISGLDYQILVEADFIVNACEDHLSADAIQSFKTKIFKTGTGKKFLDKMYRELQ